jgi:hypothetical protein
VTLRGVHESLRPYWAVNQVIVLKICSGKDYIPINPTSAKFPGRYVCELLLHQIPLKDV